MRRLSTIVAAAVMATAVPLLASVDNHVRKDLQVSPGGTLVIKTDAGDIEVRQGSGSMVSIDVHRVARTTDSAKAKEIFERFAPSITQQGNNVTVKIERQGTSGWFGSMFGNEIEISATVTVPKNFNVDLRTAGGDVSVADLTGETRVMTSGGDLRLTRLEGKVTATTSGGDIELSNLRGAVEARTSGGDIKVRTATGALKLKTSGGGIDVAGVQGPLDAHTNGGDVVARFTSSPRDTISLSTSGGEVKLYVPEGSSFELDATTSGGEVESQIPMMVQGKRHKDSLQARVNGGGPRVELRTSAGDIWIGSN